MQKWEQPDPVNGTQMVEQWRPVPGPDDLGQDVYVPTVNIEVVKREEE